MTKLTLSYILGHLRHKNFATNFLIWCYEKLKSVFSKFKSGMHYLVYFLFKKSLSIF